MARYLEYAVDLPLPENGGIDATVVRAKIAAQMEMSPEYGFDRRIFHYTPDKHPAAGVSPFRFGGGKSFRIYASGEDAVQLLSAEAHKVTRLLELAYGVELCERRRTGIYSAGINPTLQTFRIPSLVLQQSPNQYRKLMTMNPAEREEWIGGLILKGLANQFRTLGLTFELDDPMFVFGDVSVGGGYSPIEVKPGIYFLSARRVTFRANIRLEGPYHVGHLVSRGYGAILRDIPKKASRPHRTG